MTFTLNSTNPTASKMREEMYLKHLRQVERINNRQANDLKKSLKYHRSISELHKNNKKKANQLRNQQIKRTIQDKNSKIERKIKQICSGDNMKHPTLLTVNTAVNLRSIKNKQNSKNISDLSLTQVMSPGGKLKEHIKTLHYQYRLRQQRLIQQQNTKLTKPIQQQKSVLLPSITTKNRHTSDVNKSRHKYTQKSVNEGLWERKQQCKSEQKK